MLTRSRLQRGEGELEEFDLEIGSRRGKMSSPKGEEATSSIPSKGEFLKDFMRMQTMVEELYQNRKRGEQGGPSHVEGKKGSGEEPPKSSLLILMVLYILRLKSKKQKLTLMCLN